MAKVIRYTKYGYEIYDTETMSYKMLDSTYTHVSDFIDGFAKITIKDNGKNKHGYIDESGKEVVPAIYDDISDIYIKNYVFVCKYNNSKNIDSQWFILNIHSGYSSMCELEKPGNCEDFHVTCIGNGVISTICSTNGWSGFQYHIRHYRVANDGELKPFLNDSDCDTIFLSNYSNNCALVKKIHYEPHGQNRCYQRKKISICAINSCGNIICKLHNGFGRGICESIYNSHRFFGHLTHLKGTIFKFIFQEAFKSETMIFINMATDDKNCYNGYDYCDNMESFGLRRVVRYYKTGFSTICKWGYIDKSNKEVIPCKYDNATIFVDGIAKVEATNISHNGKWLSKFNGYIDINGNILDKIPPSFELSYVHNLATFKVGNITTTIDRGYRNYCRYKNAELYISGFLAIDVFINGVAVAVDKDKRCGIIDVGGNKLSEFIYDNIYDDGEYLKTHIGCDRNLFCSPKVWSVPYNSRPGNKYGYLARSGKVLIECEYDFLSRVENGVVRGCKDGKLFIIDIENRQKRCYTLDNWQIGTIGLVNTVESFYGEHLFSPAFLWEISPKIIMASIETKRWKEYLPSLYKAIDNYIANLNINKILESYKIEFIEHAACRPNKDDHCEICLKSYYIDNGDVYLRDLLFYENVLFNEFSSTAYSEYWEWKIAHSDEYENASKSQSYLTDNKKELFKQLYSKEEHKRTIARYIHNELKKKAIAKEIDKWIEPYKDLLN